MMCDVLACCFLHCHLEPGNFLLEVAMTWDRSDSNYDASSAWTNLYQVYLISTCFGTLGLGTYTKLCWEVGGGVVMMLSPLKLQWRKHIPSWFCKSEIYPNHPYHRHMIQCWFYSPMLQIHYIGSLNPWLNYMCNKRFCHFHIVVTSTRTMMIFFT